MGISPLNSQPKKIYIIAGEASGDMHGAELISALKNQPEVPVEIYGVGGNKIKESGALHFFDLAHFHVTGITQAIKKIPDYRQAAKKILSDIQMVRPDVVVLIDNPGFNLHLAKKINSLGFRIVYYISPQLWAWKKNRIHKIKKTVSKMLVVFEFEKKMYEDFGIPVAFVGHPLKDLIHSEMKGSKNHEQIISLMPGSRKNEVEVLLPIYLKAAELIHIACPNYSFQIIQAPTLSDETYDKFLNGFHLKINRIRENSYSAVARSALALVCSGTATLECALLGTPMIISNKASFLTYLGAKVLIQIKWIGLPNIILGKESMPEFLQYQATPEKISSKAVEILKNDSLCEKMKKDLREISDRLGAGGAAKNASKEILKTLEDERSG